MNEDIAYPEWEPQLDLDLDYSSTGKVDVSPFTLETDEYFVKSIFSSPATTTTLTMPSPAITMGSGSPITANWQISDGHSDGMASIAIGDTIVTEDQVKVLGEIGEWMASVDDKLAILKPNEKLEAEWSELKELRERYIQLEKELTEKSKVWDILKD